MQERGMVIGENEREANLSGACTTRTEFGPQDSNDEFCEWTAMWRLNCDRLSCERKENHLFAECVLSDQSFEVREIRKQPLKAISGEALKR
jgi:hypothetical protein